MKIHKFNQITGNSITTILGQRKYGYAQSDFEDFYEMPDFMKGNGYQGLVLYIYDYETGKVYIPFEKERNVIYGNPIFNEGYLYFLRGDFNQNIIELYKYLPPSGPEKIWESSVENLKLYNLMLMGGGVNVISQDGAVFCYYPEPYVCKEEPNESLIWIEGDKLYFSAWVEEGVEGELITEQYKYYEKLIIKNRQGEVLSEELGVLAQTEDGEFWLS